MIGKVAEAETEDDTDGGGAREDPRAVVARLIIYLYGPGRADEHRDPRIVAGWWPPAVLEPSLSADGTRDYRDLIDLLTQPLVAEPDGWPRPARPVWHCVLRAAPEDRLLDDAEWAEAAAAVMDRVGLARPADVEAVRWIAVRHADDHIHIVATMARVDGRRPALHHDHYRVSEACRDLEHRFGLRRLGARDRTAARGLTRAEIERTRRERRQVAARVALRRAVMTAAAAADGEESFFAALNAAGIKVRRRAGDTSPGQTAGYCVALADYTTAAGDPVWYGPSKLAPGLSLRGLRHRWQDRVGTDVDSAATDTSPLSSTRVSAAGPVAVVTAAATQVHRAVRHGLADGDGDDLAWATSDVVHVIADLDGGMELRLAAELYDRAARAPYAKAPAPSDHGRRLRAVARHLAASPAGRRDQARLVVLVRRLTGLVEAIAELRRAQQRLVQAQAARRAAEHLRQAVAAAAAGPHPTADRMQNAGRGDNALDLVKADFPAEQHASPEAGEPTGAQPSEPRPRRPGRASPPAGSRR